MLQILENSAGKDERILVEAVGTILRWPTSYAVTERRDSSPRLYDTSYEVGEFRVKTVDENEQESMKKAAKLMLLVLKVAFKQDVTIFCSSGYKKILQKDTIFVPSRTFHNSSLPKDRNNYGRQAANDRGDATRSSGDGCANRKDMRSDAQTSKSLLIKGPVPVKKPKGHAVLSARENKRDGARTEYNVEKRIVSSSPVPVKKPDGPTGPSVCTKKRGGARNKYKIKKHIVSLSPIKEDDAENDVATGSATKNKNDWASVLFMISLLANFSFNSKSRTILGKTNGTSRKIKSRFLNINTDDFSVLTRPDIKFDLMFKDVEIKMPMIYTTLTVKLNAFLTNVSPDLIEIFKQRNSSQSWVKEIKWTPYTKKRSPRPLLKRSEPKIPKHLAHIEYEKDQWSPVNPNGKKVYSKSFLTSLGNLPSSQKRPECLNNFNSILIGSSAGEDASNKALQYKPRYQNQRRENTSNFRSSNGSFSWKNQQRCFTVNRNTAQDSWRKQKEDLSTYQKQTEAIENRTNGPAESFNMTLWSDEPVVLNKAENAWIPKSLKVNNNKNIVETSEIEQTPLTFRSLLNKVTPSTIEKIIEAAKELRIERCDMNAVIDMLFEKAIDEPSFCPQYAEICSALQNVETVPKDGAKGQKFKALLITTCQRAFESESAQTLNSTKKLAEIKACGDKDQKDKLLTEYEDNERKLRKRSVGNCRFMCSLYLVKLLTTNIMTLCMSTLVKKYQEEPLECLCSILKNVGKELDDKSLLGDIFDQLKKISANKGTVPTRIRFMIMDIIDLRANKWVPRREIVKPTVIEDFDTVPSSTPATNDRQGQLSRSIERQFEIPVSQKPPEEPKVKSDSLHRDSNPWVPSFLRSTVKFSPLKDETEQPRPNQPVENITRDEKKPKAKKNRRRSNKN